MKEYVHIVAVQYVLKFNWIVLNFLCFLVNNRSFKGALSRDFLLQVFFTSTAGVVLTNAQFITINVLLFKKLRDIIFFCVPQKKIRSQSFFNSGTLVFLCTRVLLCTVVVCCCLLLGVLVCCFVLLRVRGVGRSPCSYVVWAGIQGEGAGWWQGSPSPSHYRYR